MFNSALLLGVIFRYRQRFLLARLLWGPKGAIWSTCHWLLNKIREVCFNDFLYHRATTAVFHSEGCYLEAFLVVELSNCIFETAFGHISKVDLRRVLRKRSILHHSKRESLASRMTYDPSFRLHQR